jgi:hypothetical protein
LQNPFYGTPTVVKWYPKEPKTILKEEAAMAFKIGFASEFLENKRMESKSAVPEPAAAPRRSMVQVYFAERNMNLAYYNDQFDLHCGDTVYVDGKLEGMRGRVTQVSYNFKIKVIIF